MKFSQFARTLFLLAVLAVALTNCTSSKAMGSAVESHPEEPTPWQTPPAEQVDATILEWLVQSSRSAEEATQRDIAARPALDRLLEGDDRLDAMVEALSPASESVAAVANVCAQAPNDVPALDWLDSADVPYWMRSNVRLYVARCLIRQQHYEQGLAMIEGIQPADVFDPASLLFYRSIAEHQLVRIDDAKQSLRTLLNSKELLPERYRQIARLMQSDIAQVKDDSLDHIARRMSDVERRLDLGKADEAAQKVERGILASLDKMIEKLEEQQRRQQQQQQQQAGGQPSAQPMEESRIAEMKGEGKVDIKDIGEQVGWGDMPPRDRERVLQQIGRDFPGHYRDLMEEYLKRLATDEREQQQP